MSPELPEVPSHIPDDIDSGSGAFLPDEYEVMGRLWMVFLNAVTTRPMLTAQRLVTIGLQFSLSFQSLHKTNSGRATQLALFTISVMADQHLVDVSTDFKRVAERRDLEMVPDGYDVSVDPVKATGVLSARMVRSILNAHYWANRADLPSGVKR